MTIDPSVFKAYDVRGTYPALLERARLPIERMLEISARP